MWYPPISRSEIPEYMTVTLTAVAIDLLSEEELLNRRYQRLMSYGYA